MMATKEEIAKKHGVSVAQVEQLKSAMELTWDCVSWDWLDILPNHNWKGTYNSEAEMVAEATLDADRIITFNRDKDLSWLGRGDLKVMSLGMEVWGL